VSEVAAGAIAVSVTANPPCTRRAKRTNGEIQAQDLPMMGSAEKTEKYQIQKNGRSRKNRNE
jgi:hypothetical protein